MDDDALTDAQREVLRAATTVVMRAEERLRWRDALCDVSMWAMIAIVVGVLVATVHDVIVGAPW